MRKPTILVTSAAGKTGAATVLRLLDLGFPVKAMVRKDDHRAASLAKAGAQIVVGNLLDMRDLRRALQGVQRAYYCPPMNQNLLHGASLFALAAEEARLEVVALLSQWLPHPSHPSVATREHWISNNLFTWMPHVDVIHINPGLFADTYFLILYPVTQLGLLPLPVGQGRNAPPSNEDIARCAAGALANPAPHVGKTYRPTGPNLMSGEEIAQIFAKVLGRKVSLMDVNNKMFVKAARAAGFPPFEIAQVCYYNNDHRLDAFSVGGATDHVLQLTGQEPEDFETITRRYLSQRPEAQQTMGNKLRALTFMMRMMLTRASDLRAWEKDRGLPMLTQPQQSTESDEWCTSAKQRRLALL